MMSTSPRARKGASCASVAWSSGGATSAMVSSTSGPYFFYASLAMYAVAIGTRMAVTTTDTATGMVAPAWASL